MAKTYRSQSTDRKAQNDVTSEETFIQWDETKINDFNTILSTKIHDFAQVDNLLGDSNCDTDAISKSLSDILVECSHLVFGRKRISQKDACKQYRRNAWFKQEYHEARKNFKKARNAYNKNKQNADLRQNYLLAK